MFAVNVQVFEVETRTPHGIWLAPTLTCQKGLTSAGLVAELVGNWATPQGMEP